MAIVLWRTKPRGGRQGLAAAKAAGDLSEETLTAG